ncbi:hypothetical protein WDV93_13745 [Pantoea ananatis]
MTQAWGGVIDCMPDDIPVISAVPQLPGLILSCGYALAMDLVLAPVRDVSRRTWSPGMLGVDHRVPLFPLRRHNAEKAGHDVKR